MKMNRYEIILYWSEEDHLFVAEVPELPGCMAHGETQSEAIQNIQEAMSFWLDTARELGRIIPEPRGRLMYA
jgi:predicted RNase H-like HicB family nuclease